MIQSLLGKRECGCKLPLMGKLSVISKGDREAPINDLPPQERLGAAIRRGRVKAAMSRQQLAERLGLPLKVMSEIESGRMVASADQIHEISGVLNLSAHMLLEAATEWHRAVWGKDESSGGGVKLDEITGGVATPGATDADVDAALVKAHDTLVFMANVTSHVSREVLTEVQDLRGLMRRRGIDVPDDKDTDGAGRHMRTLSIAEVEDKIVGAVEEHADEQNFEWGPVRIGLDELAEIARSRSEPDEAS